MQKRMYAAALADDLMGRDIRRTDMYPDKSWLLSPKDFCCGDLFGYMRRQEGKNIADM